MLTARVGFLIWSGHDASISSACAECLLEFTRFLHLSFAGEFTTLHKNTDDHTFTMYTMYMHWMFSVHLPGMTQWVLPDGQHSHRFDGTLQDGQSQCKLSGLTTHLNCFDPIVSGGEKQKKKKKKEWFSFLSLRASQFRLYWFSLVSNF